MFKRALIIVAALAVACSTTGPAFSKVPPKKQPTLYAVGAYVILVDKGGVAQCGTAGSAVMMKVSAQRTDSGASAAVKKRVWTTNVFSCTTGEGVVRTNGGTWKLCLTGLDAATYKQADGCKTLKVGKNMRPPRFIVQRLTAASGSGGSGDGQTAAQGSAQSANTSQGAAGQCGNNCSVSNNNNANTNQNDQQTIVQVIVNQPPPAPAPTPTPVENKKPTARIMSASHEAHVGGQLTFTATGSDSENDPLTYHWTVTGPNGSKSFTATSDNAPQITLTFLDLGDYNVSVTCNDGHNGPVGGDNTITVTVIANSMP